MNVLAKNESSKTRTAKPHRTPEWKPLLGSARSLQCRTCHGAISIPNGARRGTTSGPHYEVGSVLDTVGNTPLMPIGLIKNPKMADIYAKLEFLNPSGSIKDRIAKYLIEEAERRGILKSNSIIVEATSGNTGIALAMVGAIKKYKVRIIMPEHMSQERMKIIRAYGAQLILTPKKGGFTRPVEVAQAMAAKDSRVFLPSQFTNLDNTKIHRLTTGREILEQCRGRIDAFVAGIGTGGTLMGVGEALREAGQRTQIVAVEPSESAVMSGSTRLTSHHIAGIGDGFIPDLVDMKQVDRVVKIKSIEAIKMAKRFVREMGLPVGVSSGANYLAAIAVAKTLGRGKTVVTVLPDRMERYFSTLLFKN